MVARARDRLRLRTVVPVEEHPGRDVGTVALALGRPIGDRTRRAGGATAVRHRPRCFSGQAAPSQPGRARRLATAGSRTGSGDVKSLSRQFDRHFRDALSLIARAAQTHLATWAAAGPGGAHGRPTT